MSREVRTLLITAAAAVLLAMSPGTSAAASGVRAVLDGQPISLERAGELSCHDFAYPILTCFATSAELEAAAEQAAAGGGSASGGTAFLVTSGYVIVYEDGGYLGAAQAISQNYSYLGDIGWNDKISSLRSYGAAGHFWEHAPVGGFIYYFYSTTWVSYVGDAYNDRFSSVYLN